MTEILEISDVIVDYNADTLERRPVHKEAALERLRRMFPDRIGLNIGGLRGWSVLGPLL